MNQALHRNFPKTAKDSRWPFFFIVVLISTFNMGSCSKSRVLRSKMKHNTRGMHKHQSHYKTNFSRNLQNDDRNRNTDDRSRNNDDRISNQNDYYDGSNSNLYGSSSSSYGSSSSSYGSSSSSYGSSSSSYASGKGDDDWSSNQYSDRNDDHKSKKKKKSFWSWFGNNADNDDDDVDRVTEKRHSWNLFGGRNDDDYSSPSSSSSSSSYGSSSYGSSSYGGSSSSYKSSYGSNSSKRGKYSDSKYGSPGRRGDQMLNVEFVILLSFFFAITTSCGMLYTAYAFTSYPEGNYANCCRLSLSFVACFQGILYNLYHCRLAEAVDIICPGEDDEHDFTEEELDKMKLRPGIERALEKEHGKAMKKMEVEMGNLEKVNEAKSWKHAFGLIT